jgi:tRNA(fMet)-specific endonuclease VapC
MLPALIDTDTLSGVMKNQRQAMIYARTYLATHNRLTLSLMTRYEVLRGLRAKQAAVQEAAFERFCNANVVLPITDAIVVRAAAIYGDLHRQGALIGDADILIAATALEHGLALVSNNTSHFSRIAGLQLDNWLRP